MIFTLLQVEKEEKAKQEEAEQFVPAAPEQDAAAQPADVSCMFAVFF